MDRSVLEWSLTQTYMKNPYSVIFFPLKMSEESAMSFMETFGKVVFKTHSLTFEEQIFCIREMKNFYDEFFLRKMKRPSDRELDNIASKYLKEIKNEKLRVVVRIQYTWIIKWLYSDGTNHRDISKIEGNPLFPTKEDFLKMKEYSLRKLEID